MLHRCCPQGHKFVNLPVCSLNVCCFLIACNLQPLPLRACLPAQGQWIIMTNLIAGQTPSTKGKGSNFQQSHLQPNTCLTPRRNPVQSAAQLKKPLLFKAARQKVNVSIGSSQRDLLHCASRFLLFHAKQPTFTDNDSRGWLESFCALFVRCSCCQSFAVKFCPYINLRGAFVFSCIVS